MTGKRFENQRVLFARTGLRTIELAFKGDGIAHDLREFELQNFIEIPKEPGIYLWEGEWEYAPPGWAGSERVDADSQWSGATRPATSADIAGFGFAIGGDSAELERLREDLERSRALADAACPRRADGESDAAYDARFAHWKEAVIATINTVCKGRQLLAEALLCVESWDKRRAELGAEIRDFLAAGQVGGVWEGTSSTLAKIERRSEAERG